MKTSPLFLLLFAALSCMLGCNGCNDDCYDMTDPDCINYDYCSTVPELEAAFKVFRKSGTLFIDTTIVLELELADTSYYGWIYFRALEEADAYTWQLGTDDADYTEREFDLLFRENAVGPISFTLSVERELDDCPELGQQSASSTQDYTIIDPPILSEGDTTPIVGRYLGNNESEPDSSDFVIDFAVGPNNVIHLRHFPRGAQNDEFYNDIRINSDYKNFLFLPNDIACCQSAYGYGYLSDDKRELRIEYRTLDTDTWTWKDLVWTGVRQ